LSHLLFTDEKAAREVLERIRWPNGPTCPACEAAGLNVARLGGQKQSHRPGLYRCKSCRAQFTVTVGTKVFQGTRVPLSRWIHAVYLLGQDASVAELARETELTYKTAWHMAQEIGRILAAGKKRERDLRAAWRKGKRVQARGLTTRTTGLLSDYCERGDRAALMKTERLLRALLDE